MGIESPKPASTPTEAVFLSYASQDADAAQRICEALRAAGIEVWFDQSELRGGDAWDRRIREQIHECRLFMPIVSANTEARVEGYFRREWRLAVDRTHALSERVAFVVPVVIDSTSEQKADVPDAFRHVQWTRLSGGHTTPAFVERVGRLLSPNASTARAAAAAPPSSTAMAPTSGKAMTRVRRFKAALRAIGGIAAVALISLAVVERAWLSKRAAPVEARTISAAIADKSVAVLPFLDMSEKKDQEYLADGLTEELIERLSQLTGVRIPARTSSFYFKGKSISIAEAARMLSVATVLEGSVRKSGDNIRITAQLIRADTGDHLWSQSFDRKLNDVFHIQDEVATAVAVSLRASLAAVKGSPGSQTSNMEAYHYFLEGKFQARHFNPDAMAIELQDFQRAVELDPEFGAAWAALGRVYFEFYAANLRPWSWGCAPAREALTKALRTDQRLVAAHVGLADVAALCDWNWKEEDDRTRQALALDPNSSSALESRASYLEHIGDSKGAVQAAKDAVVRDPFSPVTRSFLAWRLLLSGQYEAAIDSIRSDLKLDPTSQQDNFMLAYAFAWQGRLTEAAKVFALDNDRQNRDWGAAFIQYRSGHRREGDAMTAEFSNNYGDEAPVDIARLYATGGHADEAFHWLDVALERRTADITYIRSFPEFTALRTDIRFKRLVEQMNLPPETIRAH